MSSPDDNLPDNALGAIIRAAEAVKTVTVAPEAKAAYNLEKEAYEDARHRVENDILAEQLENSKQDRKLRERYATYAFGYLVFYTGFCVILVVAQGSPNLAFKLSDAVIITLVGSTAVAAIGLVGFIARGLFKAPD